MAEVRTVDETQAKTVRTNEGDDGSGEPAPTRPGPSRLRPLMPRAGLGDAAQNHLEGVKSDLPRPRCPSSRPGVPAARRGGSGGASESRRRPVSPVGRRRRPAWVHGADRPSLSRVARGDVARPPRRNKLGRTPPGEREREMRRLLRAAARARAEEHTHAIFILRVSSK